MAQPESRASRHLAVTLDGLVRTARSGAGLARPAAERMLAMWREHPDTRLGPRPTGICCGEELVLEAAEAGPWVLPAYVAGLRWLRPDDDAGVDALLRLVVELGATTPRGGGIDELQAFLWGDGAEGFQVGLANGITDALDAVEVLRREDEALAAVRAAGVRPLVGELVASHELDIAAMHQELSAPLRTLGMVAERPELLPDDGLRERMREAVASATTWAAREVLLVVRHPDLRPVVPAERIARRLADALAGRADARSLRLLGELAGHEDAWSTALLESLAELDLGEAIARGLVPDDPDLAEVLRQLAPRLPEALAGAVAVGIATRIHRDDLPRTLLDGLLALIPTSAIAGAQVRVEAGAAGVLIAALERARAPRDAVLALLGSLTPHELSATLAELPESTQQRLRGPLVRRLLDDLDTVPIALGLLEGASGLAWRVVAEALEGGRGQQWRASDLARACAGLANSTHGAEVVVGWIRDGKQAESLRLAAIDAVADTPRLVSRVLAFRAGAVLDPPAVKTRLKDLRSRA